jgi:hypothetical protein
MASAIRSGDGGRCEHARGDRMSLAGVLARKGAAVTFTHATPGTYDPATDTTTAAPR